MAKRKEKQSTDLEKQRSLSAFGFGRSVTQRPGPSTSESTEGKTSSSAASQRESPCRKKISESTKTFREKWTLEFPRLYRGPNGLMFCKTCKGMNNRNTVFGDEGSKNYQRSALSRHQESLEHLSTVNFKPGIQRPIGELKKKTFRRHC